MTVELHQLALYAVAYFIMVASPGPFVAAIVARSAAFGFRTGASLALGAFLAEKLWMLAAMFGLAVLAATYSDVLVVLKWAGAAWLVWLGLGLIFGKTGMISPNADVKPEPFWRGILTGAFINLGNPKDALFFMVLFPGFFDVSAFTWMDALVIIGISAPIGLGCDFSYAYLASKARSLLTGNRLARRIDQTTGGLLCGAGAAIAAT
ncbi:MAG: LysE family translocator [Pseudomonadota bacterium]